MGNPAEENAETQDNDEVFEFNNRDLCTTFPCMNSNSCEVKAAR